MSGTHFQAIPRQVNFVRLARRWLRSQTRKATLRRPFEAVAWRPSIPEQRDREIRAYPMGREMPGRGSCHLGVEHGPDLSGAWYQEPDSGVLKYGWTPSAEFAGQPVHRSPIIRLVREDIADV